MLVTERIVLRCGHGSRLGLLTMHVLNKKSIYECMHGVPVTHVKTSGHLLCLTHLTFYTFDTMRQQRTLANSKGKGKVFPYSLPSVGPGADPGVQAVSPQVT